MKIAVVTGGARGLGRAFAQALGAAGWQVAIVARQAVDVEGARSFIADVTDEAAIRRAAADSNARWDRSISWSTMPA